MIRYPQIYEILIECEILSNTPTARANSSDLIDSLFCYKSINSKQKKPEAKRINRPLLKTVMANDYDHYDLKSLLLNRTSTRKPSGKLNSHSLGKLLDLIFREKHSKAGVYSRLYPSAGCIYEVYPIIQVSTNEFEGLKKGIYSYQFGSNEPFKLISTKINSSPDLFFECPNICISLIADLEISKDSYGPLALKLAYLNAGVLLTYFYIFSAALGINGCAYGIENIKRPTIKKTEQDVGGFCLF
jgi:hypothetical protein